MILSTVEFIRRNIIKNRFTQIPRGIKVKRFFIKKINFRQIYLLRIPLGKRLELPLRLDSLPVFLLLLAEVVS